ncbi:MFS general substrate transporter [Phanerochaete sordida]|uniref:MFS general substrate transporter n=1 Tax=Phanerochaete sordida TaxID=48140 RepID=A0A9P3G3S9_9APHY|nr:MFS general substrate transporter [Phanerochaete sordida]
MKQNDCPAVAVVTEPVAATATPSFPDSRPQNAPFSPASSKASSTSTLVGDYEPAKPPSLSTFRLFLAHFGAALTLFLATTDATIVSTILPTISSDFNASQLEYTWVGVAYMLTQTAFQPLYGKISDLIGRKTVLYSSMLVFVTGSILCGGSQSMLWLIIARALAGIGGGGIVSLVWTITSEIVEERSRAQWSQALSITWSCSAIAGPLLGGVFSNSGGFFSWRWAFYLNLPVCVVALVVLLLALRGVDVGASHHTSWRRFAHTFDFIGLLLFMCGSSCIIIGFSFSGTLGWVNPGTLILIISGLAVLILGGCYEVRTKRDALFPRTAFVDSTTIIILVVNFLHNLCFNAGTFYLALYFQSVEGLQPVVAGLHMLPYSLGSSIASLPVAWYISWWQKRKGDTSGQKLMICSGLCLAAVGFGLMITLNDASSHIVQYIFPLLCGVGLGMLFHAPYQIFTKTLRPKELASGTSAFFLVRFTGATVGLSVAGAVFNRRLSQSLPAAFGNPANLDLDQLNSIIPLDLQREVIHAVSTSIQTIWAICCPCLGVAFMISFFLKNLAFKENSRLATEAVEKSADAGPPTLQVAGGLQV